MKFSDLPRSMQAQIRKGQAISAEKTVAIHRPGPPEPPKPRSRQVWRCHDCGERFTQWAPAQRHSNDSGHVRIDIVLPGEP